MGRCHDEAFIWSERPFKYKSLVNCLLLMEQIICDWFLFCLKINQHRFDLRFRPFFGRGKLGGVATWSLDKEYSPKFYGLMMLQISLYLLRDAQKAVSLTCRISLKQGKVLSFEALRNWMRTFLTEGRQSSSMLATV